MLNETVANQPSIHENVNRIAIELLNLRLRNKPMQPHLAEIVSRGAPPANCHPRPQRIRIARVAPPRWRLRQTDTLQGLHRRERNQLVERLASKHLVYALAMTSHGRRDQQRIRRRVQFEMLLRMRQRIVRYQRCDVRKLGRLRSQKFLARRRIKEKIANRDRSSRAAAPLLPLGLSCRR